jgi:uncharacterized repeat protein (TIGR04138 family)
LLDEKRTIEYIAACDGRYDVKALQFVFEGLGVTVERIQKQHMSSMETRHISGDQLADGLGQLAIDRWGRLAMMVLGKWGVTTTRDFGEIVYLMIENEWMSAQPTDTIEDFDNVFDFEKRFEKDFQFAVL